MTALNSYARSGTNKVSWLQHMRIHHQIYSKFASFYILVHAKWVLVTPQRRVRPIVDHERDYLQSLWRNNRVIGEVVSYAKVYLHGLFTGSCDSLLQPRTIWRNDQINGEVVSYVKVYL